MAPDSRTFAGMSNTQQNPSSLQPVAGDSCTAPLPWHPLRPGEKNQLPADTSSTFLFIFYWTLSWIYTHQPYRANKHISASSAAAYGTCTSYLFWNNLFHCLFRVVFRFLSPKQSTLSTRAEQLNLLAATQLSRCLCERVRSHNVTHQCPKRTNALQSTSAHAAISPE